jgi:hypothetical protein
MMTTKQARDIDTTFPQDSCPKDRLEYYRRPESERGTYLYLGYGSNLSNETFRGSRGIKTCQEYHTQNRALQTAAEEIPSRIVLRRTMQET